LLVAEVQEVVGDVCELEDSKGSCPLWLPPDEEEDVLVTLSHSVLENPHTAWFLLLDRTNAALKNRTSDCVMVGVAQNFDS